MKRLVLVLAAAVSLAAAPCPTAHADVGGFIAYPCQYPFVGSGAQVNAIGSGGGQFCDGPVEINGSHWHCASGGGGISGGGIGLAPIAGVTLGTFGGGGIGGSGALCQWQCPDMTPAPPPNPPAAWVNHLVVQDKYNDCRDHMTPAGDTSTPQAPQSGPPDAGPPAPPPIDESASPISVPPYTP